MREKSLIRFTRDIRLSGFMQGIVFSFFVTCVVFFVMVFPTTDFLEERYGLGLLFTLRGSRAPPPDVVVISIDHDSAERLNLPDDPDNWPRSVHAQLIDRLQKEGSAVIVFDLFFKGSRSKRYDELFARSIRNARNVILCECLEFAQNPLSDEGSSPQGEVRIVKAIPPVQLLSESALATAPFPLPKIPVDLSQYWTFKTLAGDMPTLPVVAFQIFSLDIYKEFIDLLRQAGFSGAESLPESKAAFIQAKNVKKIIGNIREMFVSDPESVKKTLEQLAFSGEKAVDMKRHQMLKSLVSVYSGPQSHYLNFYGPPHTITTVPYYQLVSGEKSSPEKANEFSFHDKAVFVGLSAQRITETNEGFYTIFSKDGLDISGVEIAATAFANLMEDMPVRPLSLSLQFAIILFWGMMLGVLCRQLPNWLAFLVIVALSAGYLSVAEYQFRRDATWYPVFFPLFFQVPVTFFGTTLLKYVEVNKERQSIRKAFEYYLPKQVVDKLSKNIANMKTASQFVYGVCLYTDAENYTSLSEKLTPTQLGKFMNNYYETVFKPIKRYDGYVSNVIGDSVLAIWVSLNPESGLKRKACSAALDIVTAVRHFNRVPGNPELNIRISIHSGNVLLENIGALDHYEYRPIGDMVNTASRVDGLNKRLGTRVLATQDVLAHTDGFLTREVGRFLLVGKENAVVVHEIVCRLKECTENQKTKCVVFAQALDAFRHQAWDEAITKFRNIIDDVGEDGPSHFYLKMIEHYKDQPPGDIWDGSVRMESK
jgi:adenylate cyclase